MQIFKKQLKFGVILLVIIVCLSLSSQAASFSNSEMTVSKANGTVPKTARAEIQVDYGKLPLLFIQNDGQMDERVRFYEKGSGHTTFFTTEGVYLSLAKMEPAPDSRTERSVAADSGRPRKTVRSEFIKLAFLNANKKPQIMADELLAGKVNYLIGNDSSKWKTNIPTYKAVVYKNIYKDIDVRFYGNNRQLEYDIIVKPGADPSIVRICCQGIRGLSVTEQGDLEIGLKDGKLIQKRPHIYQQINGKTVEVEGAFVVKDVIASDEQGHTKLGEPMPGYSKHPRHIYGFEIGSYNRDCPLIIDPWLSFSTYLGGLADDFGRAIAVDGSSYVYVTGYTSSYGFPTTPGAYEEYLGGGQPPPAFVDAFVTKINTYSSSLVYSTYLGGSSLDYGWAIAIDSSGNAYITGETNSTNFPTTSNVIQGKISGMVNAFVTKINSSGSALSYSTYLGGNVIDEGHGIVVDASGNVYITGRTNSTNFPRKPAQAVPLSGGYDAFITNINSSGSALIYSLYLGGSDDDEGRGIALDGSGNAYVTGQTSSTDFPTWPTGISSPFQTIYGGDDSDAFVTVIKPGGQYLTYSTYLGGSSDDVGQAIAVDASGNAYVTGSTDCFDFPTTTGAFQEDLAGDFQTPGHYVDAFITKINPGGTKLHYSTYLGGKDGYEVAYGIAVDNGGNAYVTGYTDSADFPTAAPIQANKAAISDVFVTKINSSGSGLHYSTFLGGNDSEIAFGIALGGYGNAYVVGHTDSTNFPTVSTIQGTNAGDYDLFVAKIHEPLMVSFPYRGTLLDDRLPAWGDFDIKLIPYGSPDGPDKKGATIKKNDVSVADGDFKVDLDPSYGVLDGNPSWLEISVRPSDSDEPDDFVTLSPRQEITAVPYALYAVQSGTAGQQGPPGPQGPPGEDGGEGPPGSEGPAGQQGPKGDTGNTGPAGLQGPEGPQGLKGDTGDTGSIGPIGPEGPQGLKGDTGDTGPIGPIGPEGPQGLKGDTGDTGPIGPQGPEGPQGLKGDTGDTGPIGPEGPIGPQGPEGPPGDSHWLINGSDTYYNAGDVGIGTTSPDYKLEVQGAGNTAIYAQSSGSNAISATSSAGGGYSAISAAASAGNTYGIWGSSSYVAGHFESSDGVALEATTSSGYAATFMGGNVGIGTSSPTQKLDVAGAANLNKGLSGPALWVNGTEALWYSGTYFSWGYGGTANYFADAVGIGTSGPTESLDVNGTARLRGIPTEAGTANVYVDGEGKLWKTGSSKRYKTNIRDLEGNPARVLQLRPVRFQWKTTGSEDVGLIAEDVQQVLEDLVMYDSEGRPDSVRYDRVALYLLEVVKTQQQRIVELEELKTENKSLAQRLEALERKLEQHQLTIIKEVQQ